MFSVDCVDHAGFPVENYLHNYVASFSLISHIFAEYSTFGKSEGKKKLLLKSLIGLIKYLPIYFKKKTLSRFKSCI